MLLYVCECNTYNTCMGLRGAASSCVPCAAWPASPALWWCVRRAALMLLRARLRSCWCLCPSKKQSMVCMNEPHLPLLYVLSYDTSYDFIFTSLHLFLLCYFLFFHVSIVPHSYLICVGYPQLLQVSSIHSKVTSIHSQITSIHPKVSSSQSKSIACLLLYQITTYYITQKRWKRGQE